jgi:hypothetical protein
LFLKCDIFSHTPTILVVTLFDQYAYVMNPIFASKAFVPFNPYANIAFYSPPHQHSQIDFAQSNLVGQVFWNQ